VKRKLYIPENFEHNQNVSEGHVRPITIGTFQTFTTYSKVFQGFLSRKNAVTLLIPKRPIELTPLSSKMGGICKKTKKDK